MKTNIRARTHDIQVAVPAIKGADRWRWNADELPALTRYLELVTRTDDWQRALASCSDEQLVADYRKHLGLPQQPG